LILHLMHRLPDLLILAITVVVLTGLAMAAPFVSRHVFGLPTHEKRNSAALDSYKAVMATVAFVLAFSLVQANGNLHSVDALVDKEAATISATDRVLLRLGKPELAALRPALVKYARTLIDDEWPLLTVGQRSTAADDAFTALSRAARELAPDNARQEAMYNELLRDLDDIADFREQIIGVTDEGLPGFFWITISGLLAIGLFLAGLVGGDLINTIAVGATAAAIGLLLAFLIVVDLPFEGETSVRPTSIEKALVVIARRT
jgi:hypothetical protein